MSEQFKSIETTELVKIANAIRTKTGTTDKISLEDMPAKIAAIEGGSALPELENEGAASDLLSGKQLIDSEGNIVEGTIATKTASNLTVSGATVTVPAGYYASQATKSVATATQATPSITVSSAGKITATATQTAGYVSAGTKSGTKQLTVQAAKTVTPTKSSQTVVAKDRYTTGAVTVAAIPAQYITTTDATATAADMRSGKTAYVNGAKVTGSIADFDGSYECSGESTGGGSGGAGIETCTIHIDLRYLTGQVKIDTIAYTTVENGHVTNKSISPPTDFEYSGTPSAGNYTADIICAVNSMIVFIDENYVGPTITTDGGVEALTSFTDVSYYAIITGDGNISVS